MALRWSGPLLMMFLAYLYAEVWLHDISITPLKPFVYRQFLPLAASLLSSLLSIPIGVSVIVVIVLCAAGFALASHDLYQAFYG